MIVAIHQPQFLPWLGYFHKMTAADAFCLLDTVQFKKNEWQNRNRIKTARGWQWLTVPVSFRFPAKIIDVRVDNSTPWPKKHLQAFVTNYRKAPYFDAYYDMLSEVYARPWHDLAALNTELIRRLRDALGIAGKPLVTASQMEDLSEDPTQRLVDICRRLGGDVYLSGPDGPNYMDMDRFRESGIRVAVQQFEHPRYAQCFGGFASHMSVIDLLFNLGSDSLEKVMSSPPEPMTFLDQ